MLKKMRWHFIGAAMIAFSSVVLIVLCVINVLNTNRIIRQQDDTLAQLLYFENNGPQNAATAISSPNVPNASGNTNAATDGQSENSSDNHSANSNNTPENHLENKISDDALPPAPGHDHFTPEVQYMMRFFTVHYAHAAQETSSDLTQNTKTMTDITDTTVNINYIASITEDEAISYADTVLVSGKSHGFYKGYRYLVNTNDSGTTIIFLNSERELQMIRSLLMLTIAIAFGCLCIVFVLVVLFSKRAIAPYLRNIEMQKQFITNASHELKTPLTAIATSADVLAMTYEDDEWVHNIQSQSARLSKLILDLVTLSRFDEENPFPEKSEFSLSDVAWEITEPFAALAKAHGKTYTQSIEDHIMLVGERTAIWQMISILLDNALKYSDEHGQIHFELRRRKKKIEIEVSNTFTPDKNHPPDISRLFERFYKADPARSRQIGGSGIGLSIAKATVLAHGGTISAKQMPDSIVILASFH